MEFTVKRIDDKFIAVRLADKFSEGEAFLLTLEEAQELARELMDSADLDNPDS